MSENLELKPDMTQEEKDKLAKWTEMHAKHQADQVQLALSVRGAMQKHIRKHGGFSMAQLHGGSIMNREELEQMVSSLRTCGMLYPVENSKYMNITVHPTERLDNIRKMETDLTTEVRAMMNRLNTVTAIADYLVHEATKIATEPTEVKSTGPSHEEVIEYLDAHNKLKSLTHNEDGTERTVIVGSEEDLEITSLKTLIENHDKKYDTPVDSEKEKLATEGEQ